MNRIRKAFAWLAFANEMATDFIAMQLLRLVRRWGLLAAICMLVAVAASGTSGVGLLRGAIFRALDSGASDRSAEAKLQDFVSVKDFGAKGDGTTDDRVALTSAHGSAKGKWIPGGTYRVGANVTLGGVWNFDKGATIKPDSGVTVTWDSTAFIMAPSVAVDTSAGGSVIYSAGSSQSIAFIGTASQTRNIVNGYAGNAIATDVGTSVIGGGGNVGSQNCIGCIESLDRITGDGVTTVFVTSFLATPGVIFVQLIRADKVRVDVTASAGLVQSGGNVQVTYPQAGHFVNDGAGGSEGANPAVLATQKLYISSTTKAMGAGSLSDYSSVLDGYDNIIQLGVRQTASGAHQRITAGSHNSILGGSYNRISAGDYGGIFGGSANEIGATGSGSVMGGFGNTSSGTGPQFTLCSTCTVSGAFAVAIGSSNTTSANGAVAIGRSLTVSAGDAFSGGQLNSVSAPFGVSFGLSNTVSNATGYAGAIGRSNTNTAAYSFASGRDNTVSGDHSRVSGKSANAALSFCDTIGGELILTLGDNQSSVCVARRQTTNATPTELRLGVASARLTIPNNTTWAYHILVVARQAGGAVSSAWEIKGVLKQDAGTASIVGAPPANVLLGQDGGAAAWAIAATADNVNKALSLTATGAAATTIDWVARIQMVEVGG